MLALFLSFAINFILLFYKVQYDKEREKQQSAFTIMLEKMLHHQTAFPIMSNRMSVQSRKVFCLNLIIMVLLWYYFINLQWNVNFLWVWLSAICTFMYAVHMSRLSWFSLYILIVSGDWWGRRGWGRGGLLGEWWRGGWGWHRVLCTAGEHGLHGTLLDLPGYLTHCHRTPLCPGLLLSEGERREGSIKNRFVE